MDKNKGYVSLRGAEKQRIKNDVIAVCWKGDEDGLFGQIWLRLKTLIKSESTPGMRNDTIAYKVVKVELSEGQYYYEDARCRRRFAEGIAKKMKVEFINV